MKLEASLVVDTNLGVQQIKTKLERLHMELQDLNEGKEVYAEVWYINF